MTDAVVIRVRDEEVARGVDGDTRRGLELSAGGGAAVVDRVTPAAGDGRDDPAPSRHLADAVVRRVRDEEVARSVDGDTGRDPQLGAGGGAPIAAEVDITGARDGGDDPGAAGDPADAVVRRVRDEEVAGGVDGDAARDPQLGAGGGAVVTAEAGVTGAGDRGDDPAAGYDLTDTVVLGVRDEEVARGVHGDAGRVPQLRARAGAPVAAEAGNTGAGDRGDDPGAGGDPADAVVTGVRDEEVARSVDGDAGRVPELRAGGGAPVAEEARTAGAGERGDDAGAGRDPADAVVRRVRDEEVAGGVDGDRVGKVQHGMGCRAAVADRHPPGRRHDDPAPRAWDLTQDDKSHAERCERLQAREQTSPRSHRRQPEQGPITGGEAPGSVRRTVFLRRAWSAPTPPLTRRARAMPRRERQRAANAIAWRVKSFAFGAEDLGVGFSP